MENREVLVPASLLLDKAWTPAAKVVWMAQRLLPAASLAEMGAQTGLSRNTILKGQRQVQAHGKGRGGPQVRIPARLLAERTVGAQAKILFGLLQTMPGFHWHSGHYTYASLSAHTCLSPNTLKHAMGELIGAGWVRTVQATRLSPIKFTLGTPELRRNQAEATVAERRLKRAQFKGEAIMQEYLSLLIDSDQFTDNARPGYLINPLTGERLELDRLYSAGVAFEYHGAQHDGASDKFSQAEVDAQHLRDLIKAGLCLYQGIHLLIIRGEDLSLQRMSKKIGQSMPLRNLAGHEPLVDMLENASLKYRAAGKSGH